MKLEVVDDLAEFPKYNYLQNFLAYNTAYIYTKFIESGRDNKSTVKTTKCDSSCQQDYMDFIVAADKFFVEVEKKKAELEKKKKNNNSINNKNCQ